MVDRERPIRRAKSSSVWFPVLARRAKRNRSAARASEVDRSVRRICEICVAPSSSLVLVRPIRASLAFSERENNWLALIARATGSDLSKKPTPVPMKVVGEAADIIPGLSLWFASAPLARAILVKGSE